MSYLNRGLSGRGLKTCPYPRARRVFPRGLRRIPPGQYRRFRKAEWKAAKEAEKERRRERKEHRHRHHDD